MKTVFQKIKKKQNNLFKENKNVWKQCRHSIQRILNKGIKRQRILLNESINGTVE